MYYRKKPEGPYETEDRRWQHDVPNENSQFLDFIDQLQNEAEISLSLKTGYSELRILTDLMRNHISGKMSTSSSLVLASGMSYGTAKRALANIEKRGLIVRRPKTPTGKSFSLHPSPKLIQEWQEFTRRTRSLIGGLVKPIGSSESRHGEYYYGASYAGSNTLTTLSVFNAKLPIRGELKLLVHADPTFMAMHALKKQLETIFGVRIWSRALSIDRLREEILNNSKARVSRYDIIACDLPWFGEMAEAGRFLPVDSLITASQLDLADFHSVALASTRYQGKQYGIPVQTTPELLVCRRDLLEERGLKPPRTITDTIATAKALHDPFKGAAGIAWNAARGTPLGHSFLFIIAALGQPILDLQKIDGGFDCENVEGSCFRPKFDSLEAREAAEYFLELLDVSPNGILNMSWYERARCYADGKASMAYSATLLAPLFELDKESKTYNNTVYLPHPVGANGRPIAPVGGYALAIPSNIAPERIGAAWDALATLTSAEAIKLYIENGSLVSPRFSVSSDPEVQRISPLISIVDKMARDGVLQVWPRPPVPEIVNIIDIAGEELHDMLLGQKNLSTALSDAQNRADALMRERGHY